MSTRKLWIFSVFIVLLPMLVVSISRTATASIEVTPSLPFAAEHTEGTPVPLDFWYVAENVIETLPDSHVKTTLAEPFSTIMSENFEDDWPGTGWVLSDESSDDGGQFQWGKRNCHPHTGNYAGWSVGGGTEGGGLPCSAEYPNNARSWAIYGPFDLSHATGADATFHVWGRTAGAENCPWDFLYAGSSIDGANFLGSRLCGDWTQGNAGNGYHQYTIDLSSRLGERQVWLGFLFLSNASTTDIGFTIDDIILDVSGSESTNTPTPTSTPTATVEFTPAGSIYLPITIKRYPPPTPTPTATPTATPTPTPPGFEAIFAIAGLLAIAYLVLRRRK